MVWESGLSFSVLGSGSGGNSVVVCAEGASCLVDAGLSLRDTMERLSSLAIDPTSIRGIFLTHEHGDHVAHAGKLARKLKCPVYGTHGTLRASERFLVGAPELVVLRADVPVNLASLEILPFAKPHDAAESVGFQLRRGNDVLGIVTDVGHVDAATAEHLRVCTALVLESNHDPAMLSRGPYPPSLKARVGGRLGHLSNDDCNRAVRDHASDLLKVLVLAHLSTTNNAVELVRGSSERILGERPGFPRYLSFQDRPTLLLRGDGLPARSAAPEVLSSEAT